MTSPSPVPKVLVAPASSPAGSPAPAPSVSSTLATPSPRPSHVDVLHLSFLPPFVPGSYNRFLGSFLHNATSLSQAMLSFWAGPPPPDNPWGNRLFLASARGLPLTKRLARLLPERFRGRRTNGISGRDTYAYAWQAVAHVRRLKPRVVVCYDGRKLGRLLRGAIDWPCRLVLAQRGFSYHLEPRDADRLYSLASFDLVWSMTRSSYRYDRDRGQYYEPSVCVMSNGIDIETFRPVDTPVEKADLRRKFGLPADAKVVLLLARQVPKKGAHLVVEAWDQVLRQVPDAFLWIVGGGDAAYAARLKATAQALGLSKTVRLEGAVPGDRVPDCYRASDLYVLPTLCGEGQARTLLEAMASGLPSITSDHPATRELYREDEVVLVKDPNLHGQFAASIVSLLQDPERRVAFGAAARKAATERFSESDRIADLERLLQDQLRLVS